MEVVAEIEQRQEDDGRGGWNLSSSGRHAFRAYVPPSSSHTDRSQLLTTRRPPRLLVDHPIVVKLTKDIVETYQSCHSSFAYSEAYNPPKRYLTNPSNPVSNGGLDNENSDLILAVNGVLVNGDTNHRYIIKELLGQGTFGQVAKCWAEQMESFVAVKIIKNQPAYRQQALVEISILNMLNEKYDPEDRNHIVRIIEHFVHQEHLCIVFEMLGMNLFELLKANNLKGLSLNLIRNFTKQILTALSVLRDASVIHCDLKPENILLTTRVESAELKLIDFGSACREFRTVYSYIQSRFYRSPEVVIGHEYTTAIDMWSFGCVAAELFLGLPLFPAQSQYDLLQRMIKILGDKPPDHILRNAKNTSKYFKHTGGSSRHSDLGQYSTYQFLTPEEYESREKAKPVLGKHYFGEDWDLKQIIMGYHMKRGMPSEEIEKERHKRLVFMDFLQGLVHFDPLKRWTPQQAAQHPFVTEGPFMGSFEPPSEAPRMPIHQGMVVDHNPVSGHWFGAGLSLQVNPTILQFGSPQYHGHNLSYGSSYGSVGSYGSFGDGNGGHGNSFGSYGDPSGVYMNHRTLSAMVNPGFGISPDPRRRMAHMPANNALGHAYLGFSPSTSSYMPMSLGVSPSNFTPPSSHFQHSPGSPSTGSPRGFGPTSPARGGALGKAAALGQYSKRMGWGSPGSGTNPTTGNRSAGADSPTFWHGGHQNSPSGNVESLSSPHAESPVQSSQLASPRGSSYHASQFKPRSSNQASKHANFLPASAVVMPKIQSALVGGGDTSPPSTSSDFNPEYSEELLFEHDGGETLGTNLGATSSSLGAMTGDLHVPGSLNLDDQATRMHMPLQEGLQFAVLRQGGMLVESNPHVFPNYAWTLARPPHHGHHFNQISPSRLGQLSAQSFPHLHQQHQTQYQPSPNQWEALSHNQYHPQGQRNGSLSVAFPSPFPRKD